ncbi:hypothetical protein A1O7_02463, partial [Cladophialophora yegresii CBS 114405]
MPPKRIQVQPARSRAQPKGYFGQVYQTLTSEENASVVISVAMFGVGLTVQLRISTTSRIWFNLPA